MNALNPLADDEHADHDDRALVERTRAGDREGLEALVRRQQAWTYNIAIRMLSHQQDAEDATQEILINARGLGTYAFVGPLLPHFRYEADALDALFAGLGRAGVRSVYVEHINLSSYIRQRLWRALRTEPREVQDVYRDARTVEHRQALDTLVAQLLGKHGLAIRLSRVLYHPRD